MNRPLEIGKAVRHARFGLGSTLSSDERRTTIEFDEHGIRTFVTELLEVDLTDEVPARKPARKRASKTAR